MISPKQLTRIGNFSRSDYNSTCIGFFQQDTSAPPSINENLEEVRNIIQNVPVPQYLIDFWTHIKSAHVEYYFGKWTLMSLKNIYERYTLIQKCGQTRVIDFAFMYNGMGYIIVAAYDPKYDKIFFREDGGNNSHTRSIHWNFIKKYIPLINDTIDFSEWVHLATGKNVWGNGIERYVVNLPYKLIN